MDEQIRGVIGKDTRLLIGEKSKRVHRKRAGLVGESSISQGDELKGTGRKQPAGLREQVAALPTLAQMLRREQQYGAILPDLQFPSRPVAIENSIAVQWDSVRDTFNPVAPPQPFSRSAGRSSGPQPQNRGTFYA